MLFKVGSKQIHPGDTVTDYLGQAFTFQEIVPPNRHSLTSKVLVTRPCEGEPDECHVISPFLFGGWVEGTTHDCRIPVGSDCCPTCGRE